ncbi:alginate export family protein [Desulfosarcina sp.]|nr:alginate export family protein [Desulfosarcina sp.]
MSKHTFVYMCAFLTVFCFMGTLVCTASTDIDRRIEELKRSTLKEDEERIIESEDKLRFDYGGWINFRYDDYDDSDNDASTLDTYDYSWSFDTRLWLKAIYRPSGEVFSDHQYSLYVRVKDLFTEERPENTAGGYDHDGPHLDYAYVTAEISQFEMSVGRKYYSIGRGIAYSDVHDGVEGLFRFDDWYVMVLGTHTLPHEDNIDLSVPGGNKESDRYFWGVEASYSGIPSHRIYSYFLMQRDFSDERPEDSLHNYTYDSEYIGVGCEGYLPLDIKYWAEIIRESGSSYIYEPRSSQDVSAWAGDFGLSYEWEDVYAEPFFTFEYGFSTGDASRVSVTDTQNGNLAGKDTNFMYFGYLPTGNVLSPRLSNLHFLKWGVSLTPFEYFHALRNCIIDIDFFQFFKYHSAGGMYDTDATAANNDIGREIDITLSWDIFSDLSLVLEYGHFMPGDAYPALTDDAEDYFSVSTVFTF